MVKIVVFGVGKTYEMKKSFFEENSNRIEIVALIVWMYRGKCWMGYQYMHLRG